MDAQTYWNVVSPMIIGISSGVFAGLIILIGQWVSGQIDKISFWKTFVIGILGIFLVSITIFWGSYFLL